MSAPDPSSPPAVQAVPKRQLTLFDSTCIIVGIIIGAGIYESSPVIANVVPSVRALQVVWLLGGILSLLGALCYVELGNAYPREGGDYVYVTRAFGRFAGFLFAWSQLWVVRPGSIGAMAYIFARYAHHLRPICHGDQEYVGWIAYAAASVVVLSAINVLGVREGKWTQNLLTTAKVLGLAAVALVGLCFAAPVAQQVTVAAGSPKPDYRLAMILVLFAFGGWNEMAYVAAEVRDPKKNILRAMLLGTVAVAAVYILVNQAFVHALGLEGLRKSEAVAGEVLQLALGDWGDRCISVLICISALGAINGQIFTGARIYYAMGVEHRLYAPLGRWSRRLGTPVWSLLIQAAITLATVVGFGLFAKEQLMLAGFGSAFERMVIFTAPVFWGFLLLVGIGLLVLRYREPGTPRPYRVPLYPVIPLIFCACTLFMLYSSLTYAYEKRSPEAIWALAALGVGVVMGLFDPAPLAGARDEGPADQPGSADDSSNG